MIIGVLQTKSKVDGARAKKGAERERESRREEEVRLPEHESSVHYPDLTLYWQRVASRIYIIVIILHQHPMINVRIFSPLPILGAETRLARPPTALAARGMVKC